MIESEYRKSAVNPSDCIGRAWNLVTQTLGIYVLVTIVFIVIFWLSSLIPFAAIILTAPMTGGLYYIALRDIDGEPINFTMMFEGFRRFVSLLIVGLIQGIPTIVLTIVSYTVNIFQMFGLPAMFPRSSNNAQFLQATQPDPRLFAGMFGVIMLFAAVYAVFSIVWAIVFYFSVPLVMDRNAPPLEAIRLSAGAGFANFWRLILLGILGFFVALLGLIAFCVVLLVAIPVLWAANAVAYRMVFPRLDGERWTGPPPPSAYGSTFGQGM